MGEKGNVPAAQAAQSVIERTTTVVTDTTGEVATAIKDDIVDTAASAVITGTAARAKRVRGKKDVEEEADETE